MPQHPPSRPDLAGDLQADASGADEHDGEEAFHLPMAGLFADPESGHGLVSLPEEFHGRDAAWRRRVLNDWIRDLQALQQALEPSPATRSPDGLNG